MLVLTKSQMLKKINGNTDCAAEFMLTNLELTIEDKEWAIKEVNRSFRLHRLPMQVTDISFTSPIQWQINEAKHAN